MTRLANPGSPVRQGGGMPATTARSMASPAGFEPATSRSATWRSIRTELRRDGGPVYPKNAQAAARWLSETSVGGYSGRWGSSPLAAAPPTFPPGLAGGGA